ncbi:MAG: ATP-dependent DNA helicase RecG [Solirubrobacterales bacterium]
MRAGALARRSEPAPPGRGFAGLPAPERPSERFRVPSPSRLSRPLTDLRGVGPGLAAAAGEAGIHTIGDLLERIPHSYRDRRSPRPVSELRVGEEATVRVEVRSARLRRPRRRGLTVVTAEVADESGSLTATWFNQPWLVERLRPGTRLLAFGVLDSRGLRVSEHEVLRADGGREEGLHTTGLVPVHPATERLRPGRIRAWVSQALGAAGDRVEALPAETRARLGLAGSADALCAAHFPASRAEAAAARRRLIFEELFLQQVALLHRRECRGSARGPALPPPGEAVRRWLGSLPFEPTGGQRRAFAEIDADVAAGEAMQRLLMGEVGSGKTVVALYAMLRAAESGMQAAMMAPTETLAEQHAATIEGLLGREGPRFGLLSGSMPAVERQRRLEQLATGELAMVVGTHALIEPSVRFAALGLCVVDEQHRFGVEQRSILDRKAPDGHPPHALHMTATPIPRTLSLAAYGDLDVTSLRELPAGRRPVQTTLLGEEQRPEAYELLRERLAQGRQAYVVCPLIEESGTLQARAAEEEQRRLAAGPLRGFAVGLLHGRMPADRRAETMAAFASGRLDALVATTVIEVGVDVPNATVIVIESAERYGVSQLHQLRGRVGRGELRSDCVLLAGQASETARARLEAVAAERDGFRLAELDLALRGEGEMLGTRQHGLARFRFASLPEDAPTLLEARAEAVRLRGRHGSLAAPGLGPLLGAAVERFGPDPGLAVPA